jgi:hypothetical protein
MNITGQVSDDSMDGLSIEISGAASGTATVNPDGSFSIDVDCPEHPGTITITITDSDGNVTTQDIEFPG